MGFDINGLDKLQDQLKQMQKSAKELDGTHEIPFSELFTESFMLKHTSYSIFDELLSAGGFSANTTEEFQAIPDAVFDKHISQNSQFSSWQEMLDTATSDYVTKKMGF